MKNWLAYVKLNSKHFIFINIFWIKCYWHPRIVKYPLIHSVTVQWIKMVYTWNIYATSTVGSVTATVLPVMSQLHHLRMLILSVKMKNVIKMQRFNNSKTLADAGANSSKCAEADTNGDTDSSKFTNAGDRFLCWFLYYIASYNTSCNYCHLILFFLYGLFLFACQNTSLWLATFVEED